MAPDALLGSAQVETTLLALKLAFLVLLYLFIWRIVRSATRDLRVPQESMILGPQQAAGQGSCRRRSGRELTRLIVVASPALGEGEVFHIDSLPLVAGRSPSIEVPLESDEYASSRHARFEPRREASRSRMSARRTGPT